ncbi:DNA-binding protein [Candidatus Magnetomoraceae bacterium gMMP-15]
MQKLKCSEFSLGRHFLGRMPKGKDLITTIEEFCNENSIEMGIFSLIGAVSSITIGYYDHKQQVYVTFKDKVKLEIVNCSGNISLKDGKPFVHAHAVFADEQGQTMGGHVFSDTIIFAGEIYLKELKGNLLKRDYDITTGLMLWDF